MTERTSDCGKDCIGCEICEPDGLSESQLFAKRINENIKKGAIARSKLAEVIERAPCDCGYARVDHGRHWKALIEMGCLFYETPAWLARILNDGP